MKHHLIPLVLLLIISRPATTQGFVLSTGHTSAINDIAFSADGRYMASAGLDNVTILWDLASGRELRTFKETEAEMKQVTFVPGKHQIITQYSKAYPQKTYLAMWDMVTGKKKWEQEAPMDGEMIMAPDGSRIYTGGKWYRSTDGELLVPENVGKELGRGVPGGLIRTTKTGENKASYEITALGVPNGQVLGSVKGRLSGAYWDCSAAALSPDNSLMVISITGFHYMLQIWKLKGTKLERTIKGYHSDRTRFLVSPDNRIIFLAEDGNLTAVDIQKGDTLYQLKGGDQAYNLTFTPDGKQLATCSNDCRKIVFRDPATGQIIREIRGHSSPLSAIRFSEDGKLIITKHSFEGRKAWNIQTGDFTAHLPDYINTGKEKHPEQPDIELKTFVRYRYDNLYSVYENYGMVFSSATKLGMALMAVDSTDWLIYDGQGYIDGTPAALKQLYFVKGLEIIEDVADSLKKYRRPGLFVQTLYGSKRAPAKAIPQKGKGPKILVQPILNDASEPELRASVVKAGMEMPVVQIYLNGHLIIKDARKEFNVYTADRILYVDTLHILVPVTKYKNQPFMHWGTRNNFEIKVLEEHSSRVAATADVYFTPQYHQQPKMILPLGNVGIVSAVALSPTGRYIATAQKDVKIWDAKTGRELRTLRTNAGWVRNLQFSPDGEHLIARYDAYNDGMLMAMKNEYGAKMWNTITGAEEPWPYPNDPYASFSDNGRFFINRTSSQVKDMATGQAYNLPKKDGMVLTGISISTDGKTAAIATYHQNEKPNKTELVYWDLVSGKEISHTALPRITNHYVFLSPGNKWVITLEIDYSLNIFSPASNFTLWKVGGKKPVKEFGVADGEGIKDICFNKAQDSIYVVDRAGRLVAWSIESGGNREILPGGLRDGFYQFFRPASALMIGRINVTEVRDIASGSLRQQYKGAVSFSNRFSLSGTSNAFVFASTGDQWAKHFAFQPGEPLKVMQHSKRIRDVIYTADGKYVVTQEEEGNGYAWDPVNGRLMQTLSLEGCHIKDLSISTDSKRALMITSKLEESKYATKAVELATGRELGAIADKDWHNRQLGDDWNTDYTIGGSDNGTIGFGNKHSRASLATLVPLDSCDWVMYTEDGYYMASRKGAEKIYFEINDQQYRFDQFDLRYNRPDKVLERTGAPKETVEAYRAAYLKRIENMGFDTTVFEKDWTFNVPRVQVAPTSIRQQDSLYTFTLTATDTLYRLDRVLLSVNGVPVAGSRELSVKARNSKQLKQELQVVLSRGHNDIRVSVLNEKGVESLDETLEAEYTAPIRKPDLYIMAIGAGSYKDTSYTLSYAAKDAEDITQLLSAGTEKYGRIVPLLLKDKEVTAKNVLAKAQALLQSGVDDKVIIFYAGHGIVDKKKDYYLGCYPINMRDPAAGGLRYDSLEALIARIPSRKKVFLLDACYSGEIDKANTNVFDNRNAQKGKVVMDRGVGNVVTKNYVPFDLMKTTFLDLRKGVGATVLAASGGRERAKEYHHLKNGAFTYCLKQALQQKVADYNKDGKVLLSELLQYLQEEVPKVTNGLQQPVSRIGNTYQDIEW